MAEIRTGRCWPCQKHSMSQYAVIYRWPAGRGRELHRAKCRHCGERLSQTTFSNLMTPHVRKGEPVFTPDVDPESRLSPEALALYKALKVGGIELRLYPDGELQLYDMLDGLANEGFILTPAPPEAFTPGEAT